MSQPPEHAVVIDHTIEAVWLRDLCGREALKHYQRASSAIKARAVKSNMEKYEAFAKYAERFEYIRKTEIERILRENEAHEN